MDLRVDVGRVDLTSRSCLSKRFSSYSCTNVSVLLLSTAPLLHYSTTLLTPLLYYSTTQPLSDRVLRVISSSCVSSHSLVW
jgi:hypothetical protein